MKFSNDWFLNVRDNFAFLAQNGNKCNDILEVGCFEGQATCYCLQTMLAPRGRIICIDHFEGSAEHGDIDFKAVYDTFLANVQEAKGEGQAVAIAKKPSREALAELMLQGYKFDFIYIDGSHMAADVLFDGCLAFSMLRKGGVILFDDYTWGDNAHMPLQSRPKLAIDAFYAAYYDMLEIVLVNSQAAFRRTQ